MLDYPGILEYAYKLNDLLNGTPFYTGYVRAELCKHYPQFLADLVKLTTPLVVCQIIPDKDPEKTTPFFPQ